jgi:hypothetical protein
MSEMITQKTASVGLLVGVRTPGGKPAVVLQVRDLNRKYYRNGCQVTAAGKLEPEELKKPAALALETGLIREVKEEVGDVVATMVEASKVELKVLVDFVSPDDQRVVTSGWDSKLRSDEFLSLVVKGDEAKGFIVCEDHSKILPYADEHKLGVVPNGEIRMFPDEIQAVRTFFSKFFGK